MFYGFLADVIAAFHLAYVSYVVVGLLLIYAGIVLRWGWVRNVWFRISHLVMILIVALESIGGMICPLTAWEDRLRALAGQTTEGDSFIGRIVASLMKIDLRWDHPIFTASYCGFAALVLVTFWLSPPRRMSRSHREAGTNQRVESATAVQQKNPVG